MRCPECHFENPESAKFCVACGEKFEKKCPACGFSNSPSFKFCAECGHNLTQFPEPIHKELSFDEKIEKIQKYLPKGLTEKILSQRDKIEGEKKQVTVMFCDMEGFTALVDKLGPEEAYSIMDDVYEILIHKVHDYEGTVNEMTGDGIMALFGAPIALEDAPQRAIRSAYAIHREMVKFSDKIKQEQEGILSLKMRIGIHTGPVVVGTLGNDLRVEFKAVGDTVNLASRMEDLAEPGATYVTEETFKLTEGLFRYESLGEKEVKGKEAPVKAYRVIGPSTRRTRFDVSAERGLTPFVGRGRELELLLDGFERAKAGRGQAYSIISEAGVGKSRLLYEFRKAVANEVMTFLEGKCLSYSREVAYHPVIDILKSNFDIHDEDGDLDIRDKVIRDLHLLNVDEATILPYLLELLSVKESGIDRIPMSPEARRYRILEALRRIVLKGAESRPLIMAIEDLHWADKSSEETIKDLLENISGSAILLIFTYRPEFVPPWGGKSYHSQVTVNRLSNRESLRMVTHLLGTEEIAPELQELILEKTEGIPFFIEEFVKSLRDLHLIEITHNRYHLSTKVSSVTIPSTIQDVIMARVDALSGSAKELLQTGSAIEREFSYPLIKRVSGLLEQELLSQLSTLKDSELLYERGIYPHSTFVFKHALAREVVYDTLLASRKKRLHEEIGKGMEELYRDRLTDHYETLAHHYFASENYEKAEEYARLSAKKAEKAASFHRAISFAQQRIACLEKMPVTEQIQKKVIDARTSLGLYLVQMNQNQAKKAVEPIIDTAIKLDYKRRLCQIYMIVGTYECTVTEDIDAACKSLEYALRLSEETKDIVTSVLASYYYAFALACNCDFKRSAEHYQRAYEINLAAGSLWGASAMLSTMAWACLGPQGKVNQALDATQKAIELAEKSGDVFSRGSAYTTYGICYYKGLFQEAERNILKGFELASFIPFYWYGGALIILGNVYWELGQFAKAKESYQKGIAIFAENGLQPSYVAWGEVLLARSMVRNGEDVDLESLKKCIGRCKVRSFECPALLIFGEILINIGDPHLADAEFWIRKGIEASERNGMRFYLGQAHASYAELFRRKGERPKAREHIGKAIEIMKECGADGWVEKYEKELDELT